MFIPARPTPRVRLFPRIYAVMGDEQDISMELSTFTAHIEAIKDVYEQIDRAGSSCSIDEIGGGTEPQEASALSMGIIDAFVEKGCKIIVTTHLNLLKAYGATRPFAMNVATDFDPRTMKPLYRLLYGMAGVSNALKVAEKRGLPAEIIEKSAAYLGKQEYRPERPHPRPGGRKEGGGGGEAEGGRSTVRRCEKRLEAIQRSRDEYLRKTEERCRTKVAALEAEVEEIGREMAKKDREALRRAREKTSAVRSRFAPEKKARPCRGPASATTSG